MTEAERIAAFEEHCRTRRRYPEPLTQALVGYLKGPGSLEQARQEWQAALKDNPHLSMGVLRPSESADQFDALDRRALNLFSVTDISFDFLYPLGRQARITAALEYLLSQGVEQQQVLHWALTIGGSALDPQGQVTPLGQYLLAYLPERADELLNAVLTLAVHRPHPPPHRSYLMLDAPPYLSLVNLLLAAQPPAPDLAWQVAQQVQREEVAQLWPPTAVLSSIAGMLLKADPDRFTPWVRELAGPSDALSSYTRSFALEALLGRNLEQHLDLALLAARTPVPTGTKEARVADALVQITGLRALMRVNPVTSWPLLEAALISRNYHLSRAALNLLNGFPFDQARPTLQHCVANGKHYARLDALDRLLKQPWEGQQDYALSILAHRSAYVRARAANWLAAQGEPLVDSLVPFLAHRRSAARLAAVQTLAHIGGQEAAALLAARLDPEESLRVKEAILDAVDVPTARAASQGPAHAPQAIIADAEATLQYIPRPALPWFDAQAAPEMCWTTGRTVPPVVVRYLLYRQSRVQKNETLSAQVSQTLPLIDRSTSGDLALALYRGWIKRGAASDEARLLPVVCVLADERLASRLRHQIESWGLGTRRTLAAQAVRALALIESDSALDALNELAKHFTRGSMRRVLKEAIAVAAAR